MKKFVFFIPAIIFAIIYGGLIIGASPSVVSPIIYPWVGLFIISGILLSKGLFWGGLPGLLPGVHFMYMSTKDTGQIINIELPMGIIVALFYLLCCGFVFYKNKKTN